MKETNNAETSAQIYIGPPTGDDGQLDYTQTVSMFSPAAHRGRLWRGVELRIVWNWRGEWLFGLSIMLKGRN